jgi:5,5'-dehydrodivanillate O-demethylase oxygenase subunit
MATTREQNERLTRVGPGTPMGNLLRRYWQPVGAAIELEREPVRRIRLLGEDLTLYRSARGDYGLIGDVCLHRCMSLEYGIPEERGLRCAYHGWLYDAAGNCVEQPYEDRTFPDARYKEKIKITAYPVEELGGLLFAYLGPQPAPLLPRWDLLVREGADRGLEIAPLPCNWLQCMDNSADPIHFEFLHAGFGNYVLEKQGRAPWMTQARHVKIEFDLFRYGIMKRRLLEGETEDAAEWTVGHPLLFPNILAVGEDRSAQLHFRVPVDDVHTMHYVYWARKRTDGQPPNPMEIKHLDLFEKDGTFIGDPCAVVTQDMIAWVGQGPISDRTRENLASSDKGVIIYHKLLFENLARIERGEDPLGIVRDRAENEPMIDINRVDAGYASFGHRSFGLSASVQSDRTLTPAR